MSFNLATDEQLSDLKEQMLVQPVSRDGDFCIGQDYPVEVKSAGDKGMGVFATRNIRKGEICCYYDGFITAGAVQATFVTGQYGFAQQLFHSSDNKIALAGFRTQLRHGGCAQMCNDASTTYTERNLEYMKNINVKEKQVGPKSMVFVSTKRIKKGQELLYSYGPDYWNNHGDLDVQKLLSEMVTHEKFRDCFKRYIRNHVTRFGKTLDEKTQNEASRGMADALSKLYDTKGDTMDDYAKRYFVSEFVRRAQEN